jgi:hypothetical protein
VLILGLCRGKIGVHQNRRKSMKRNPARQLVKTLFVCGVLSAMGVTPMFAQVFTGTLADLVRSGGTLTIDDKTFSGFNYRESGLTSFNPSQIIVTASESGGVDFLTWSGNISLVSTVSASADLMLSYIVTANPGSISMIDQRYIGNAANGDLTIDETASSTGAPTAHSDLSAGFGSPDVSDPNNYPNGSFDIGEGDLLPIVPAQSVLHVTKDISLDVISPPAGSTNLSSVNITLVEQSFHQVPEPGTLLLGSLGGGLLLFLRSRRNARRN